MTQKPTADQIAELLDYNPETGFFRWKVGRGTARKGSVAGHDNGCGYLTIMIFRKTHKAHRLAWLIHTGGWPAGHIDHINGNPSDNRIENLRDVSRAENMQNQKRAQKHSSIGLLGVVKDRNRFVAKISIGGKQMRIGSFSTPELAHAAYLEAKRKRHAGCTI